MTYTARSQINGPGAADAVFRALPDAPLKGFDRDERAADDYLLLTPDESDPIVQTVTAELSSNGLRGIRTVVHSYSTGFADLADFFTQLEQDWRGWDDVRSWRSLEGDLSIEVRHEFRHVQLRVTRAYGPGWGNNGWTATADLTIDPGEQLSGIAADLNRLASG